jgi:hypothetical protein
LKNWKMKEKTVIRCCGKPVIIAVAGGVLMVTILIPSMVAQAYSYWFESKLSYTQSSDRMALKMAGFTASDTNPTRVDWIDPQAQAGRRTGTGRP